MEILALSKFIEGMDISLTDGVCLDVGVLELANYHPRCGCKSLAKFSIYCGATVYKHMPFRRSASLCHLICI